MSSAQRLRAAAAAAAQSRRAAAAIAKRGTLLIQGVASNDSPDNKEYVVLVSLSSSLFALN